VVEKKPENGMNITGERCRLLFIGSFFIGSHIRRWYKQTISKGTF